jgi:hypothetical protein
MTGYLRVITFNLLNIEDAAGEQRQEVARLALPGMCPDVIALREVTRGLTLIKPVTCSVTTSRLPTFRAARPGARASACMPLPALCTADGEEP